MKIKRTWLLAIISLVLIFSLASCGQPVEQNSNASFADQAEAGVQNAEPSAETNDASNADEANESDEAGAAGKAGKAGEAGEAIAEPVDSAEADERIDGESDHRAEARSEEQSEEHSAEAVPEQQLRQTVTISIVSHEERGVILQPLEAEWSDGDTVLDVLKRVTRSQRLILDTRGIGVFTYVEGIDNLYEFDHGAESGWLFKVNGVQATQSAAAVQIDKGDTIEWIYSIERED